MSYSVIDGLVLLYKFPLHSLTVDLGLGLDLKAIIFRLGLEAQVLGLVNVTDPVWRRAVD